MLPYLLLLTAITWNNRVRCKNVNCTIICITNTVILFSCQIGNTNIVFCKVNRQISQCKKKSGGAMQCFSCWIPLWPFVYCKTIISWLVLLFVLIICKDFTKTTPCKIYLEFGWYIVLSTDMQWMLLFFKP